MRAGGLAGRREQGVPRAIVLASRHWHPGVVGIVKVRGAVVRPVTGAVRLPFRYFQSR